MTANTTIQPLLRMLNFINPSTHCPFSTKDLPTAIFKTHLYHTVHDIPAQQWSSLVPASSLFLQLPYLRVLENTSRSQMTFRYALMHNESNMPVAAACFQLLNIKGGENLRLKDHDTTNIKRHFKQLLIQQVNRLEFGLLICGNVFITGEHGFYYNADAIAPAQAFRLLNETIENIITQETVTGQAAPALILVKDFAAHRLLEARSLTTWNFKEVKAEPDMVLTLRPEWRTYDDYLAAFSSKYRVRAKSYHKKGKQLRRVDCTDTDLQQYFAPFYTQYRQMVEHADLNLAYATPDYFVQLKQALPDQFQVITYYVGEQPLGFISMIHTPTHTEAHLAGFDEAMNREHAVYPNILYDIVRQAIDRGSPAVVFGRTAMEIKSTLGAVGTHLNAFIRHRNCPTNIVLPHIVNALRHDNWVPRHPFKEDITEKD